MTHIILSRVVPAHLDVYWPKAREYILPAAEHANEDTEKGIIAFIKLKRYHLFLALTGTGIVGACTVMFRDTDKRKIATIIHLGGDDIDLLMRESFDHLARWVKQRGADSLMIWGRKGWERYLKPFGFEHRYTCLEKQL